MAIKIKTTKTSAEFTSLLVYSKAGIGKTFLIKTAPSPIIISSEKGLLTLKKENIPVIEVSSIAEIEEAKEFVNSDAEEMEGIETVCVDSWSEIAEIALAEYSIPDVKKGKEIKPHGQAVYGALGVFGKKFLSFFRDKVARKKNVYMTAKMQRFEDEYTNIPTWSPEAPGATLTRIAPHYFDFVFPLSLGELTNKKVYRYFKTQPDIQYYAKSRGDELKPVEGPNLTKLFNKILGRKNG